MKSATVFYDKTGLQGDITLPASKSISNRALIIQFISGQRFEIQNLSEADDTRLMVQLLQKINQHTGSADLHCLDCNNAGTVSRFLIALLSITPGNWLLTGSERMKERPVGILVNGLKQLGASIIFTGKEDFLPLHIEGSKFTGGKVVMEGTVSSQFISAMLMIAPVLPEGLEITIAGQIASSPYIDMTLRLMEHFGIKWDKNEEIITVQNQSYQVREITIEPDWSSASYWYEMAAFSCKANLLIRGLTKKSLQGDSVLPDIYRNFGVKTTFLPEGIRLTKSGNSVEIFEYDFTSCPDLAPAVIATCAGLKIPALFTGLENLKFKESDRLSALLSGLSKFGYRLNLSDNSELRNLSTNPSALYKVTLNPYGDHRIAMAFAPLAILHDPLQIENPDVVSKSYPDFWDHLTQVGFKLS